MFNVYKFQKCPIYDSKFSRLYTALLRSDPVKPSRYIISVHRYMYKQINNSIPLIIIKNKSKRRLIFVFSHRDISIK